MPAQAIIAALSVQSSCGGAMKRKPYAPHCASSAARICLFAATPPAITSTGATMSGCSPRNRARQRPTRSASESETAAWNEEQTLPSVIAEIQTALPEADILVVNDGSTDRTVEVARAAGAQVLDLPINLGVGGAMRAGYKYALRKSNTSWIEMPFWPLKFARQQVVGLPGVPQTVLSPAYPVGHADGATSVQDVPLQHAPVAPTPCPPVTRIENVPVAPL